MGRDHVLLVDERSVCAKNEFERVYRGARLHNLCVHWHEVTDAHRVPATTCCAPNDRRNAACDSDAVPDVRLGQRALVGGTRADLLVEDR